MLLREGATGQREVVLIDWADCGVAPLGAELNALVGTSSLVFGWPPARARELDQIVFASYLDGLAASGWTGDARQVRLGYVGWCAMYYGRIFPGFLRYWCTPENRSFALQQFGMAEKDDVHDYTQPSGHNNRWLYRFLSRRRASEAPTAQTNHSGSRS